MQRRAARDDPPPLARRPGHSGPPAIRRRLPSPAASRSVRRSLRPAGRRGARAARNEPKPPPPRRATPPATAIEEVDIDAAGPRWLRRSPRRRRPRRRSPRRQPAPAPAAPAPAATARRREPASRSRRAPEASSPATQALYDRGYTLYHQGHYVDAEASFQRFLQANPGSELADNAQYWIGECRYSRNDIRGALAAFRETVERFPRGTRCPTRCSRPASAWRPWATWKAPA